MEDAARGQPGSLYGSNPGHVCRRLERPGDDRLRSEHGGRRSDEDAVPEQPDSYEPHRSDLAKVLEVLQLLQPAGPDQKLHAVQRLPEQPGWVYTAYGLRGIVEVAMDGPL